MKLTSLILAIVVIGVMAEEIRIPLTPIDMPTADPEPAATEDKEPEPAAEPVVYAFQGTPYPWGYPSLGYPHPYADLNRDGIPDYLQYPRAYTPHTSHFIPTIADWDGDGDIDIDDWRIQASAFRHPATWAHASTPVYDWDRNGVIDSTDVVIQQNLQTAYTPYANYPVHALGSAPVTVVRDFDHDGDIDEHDFQTALRASAVAVTPRAYTAAPVVAAPAPTLYNNYGDVVVEKPYVSIVDTAGNRTWNETDTFTSRAQPTWTHPPTTAYRAPQAYYPSARPAVAAPVSYAAPVATAAPSGKTYATKEEAIAAGNKQLEELKAKTSATNTEAPAAAAPAAPADADAARRGLISSWRGF